MATDWRPPSNPSLTQKSQYPLIKEYTLNHHIIESWVPISALGPAIGHRQVWKNVIYWSHFRFKVFGFRGLGFRGLGFWVSGKLPAASYLLTVAQSASQELAFLQDVPLRQRGRSLRLQDSWGLGFIGLHCTSEADAK